MAVIANLIVKVAADVAELKAGMDKAESAVSSAASAMSKAAAVFGVAFSVQAVTRFVGSVLDSASAIHDMSLKLGISAEAAQGFKFAAEQAGSSIDAVGTAVTKMNQHLAAGDKSTIQALKAAGLSFAEIRAMRPEDAFLAIADAIQKIPDPMVQTQVAMALFGKSAAELLPAIKEGFRAASDGAAKMSNDTIASLERAQDAWSALGNKVTIVSGGMIAEGLKFFNVWGRMKDDLETYGIVAAKVATVPPPKLLTQDGVAQIKYADAALSMLTDGVDVQRVAFDKLSAAHEAEMAAMKRLTDHIFGRDLIARAAEYATALGGIDNISKLMPAAQAEMNRAFGAAYDALVKAGLGASAAAIEYDKLRTATTNWTAINAQLAAMPDPFAKQLQDRRQKMRDVEVGILNQNAGLSASEQYWAHAGEIADAAMAKARDAVASVGPTAAVAASQMQQSFSFAFSGISNDADATARRIAQLNADADQNIKNGRMFAGDFLSGQLAFFQRQSAQRLANDLPQFATGGPVTRDGPIYAHAGEFVVPKGGGGGITMTVIINGQGAAAGREAADALRDGLMSKGVRI